MVFSTVRRLDTGAMAMLRIGLVVLGMSLCRCAAGWDVRVTFTNLQETEPADLFYKGTVFGESDPDYEVHKGNIPAGNSITQYASHGHMFIFRSTDVKYRMKVTVYNKKAAEELHKETLETFSNFPHQITLKNLHYETGEPVEIQHSEKDYTWLEPGKENTQNTEGGHNFTIRSKDKSALLQVLLDAEDDEL